MSRAKTLSAGCQPANASNVEDSDNHEIFDINDFTTASDWERFVVHMEELINEWKLNSSSSNSSDGKNKANLAAVDNDVSYFDYKFSTI
jgi:hypothetical protein